MAIAHDYHPGTPAVSRIAPDERHSIAAVSTTLGAAGLALSWIPLLNYLGVALGALGLVFGSLGIIRTGRPLAVAGTLLSLATIMVSFAAFATGG